MTLLPELAEVAEALGRRSLELPEVLGPLPDGSLPEPALTLAAARLGGLHDALDELADVLGVSVDPQADRASYVGDPEGAP